MIVGEPLHERAAAAVLAGQPDRAPVQQQRAERDDLRAGPVDRALGDRGARRCSCGITFGCTVKPSGSVVCASAILFSTSGVIAVASAPSGLSG